MHLFDQNASRDVVDLMGEETYMLPYKMDIDEKYLFYQSVLF